MANVEFLAFGPAVDPVPDNGTIDVSSGTFVILGGDNSIAIEAGATAEIDSAASGSPAYGGSVTFEANSGTLVLDSSQSYTGTINGFGAGTAVDARPISPIRLGHDGPNTPKPPSGTAAA